MAKVLLKYDGNLLKEFELDAKDSFQIGRSADNDIHIDDATVSSCHAGIEKQGDRFFIEDLNSLNGTYANRERISAKVQLNNGDKIFIGRHVLTFVSEDRTESQKLEMEQNAEAPAEETKETKKQQDGKNKPEQASGGLVVLEGSMDKKEYLLNRRVISIGKDKTAAIRLKGLFTPDFGAFINKNKDGYCISPASGSKLTKVNGKILQKHHQLREGDIIKVGNATFQFYME